MSSFLWCDHCLMLSKIQGHVAQFVLMNLPSVCVCALIPFSVFVWDSVRCALTPVRIWGHVCVTECKIPAVPVPLLSLRASWGYAWPSRMQGVCVWAYTLPTSHSCPTCPHLITSHELLPLLLSPKSLLTASLPRAPEHWWLHEQNYPNTTRTWGNVTSRNAHDENGL